MSISYHNITGKYSEITLNGFHLITAGFLETLKL